MKTAEGAKNAKKNIKYHCVDRVNFKNKNQSADDFI